MSALTATLVQPQLLWIDITGQAHTLIFDNVLKEEWDEGATVTEHPVEVGPDVADHIRVNLPKCTLTIRSTNEPFTLSSTTGGSPVQSVLSPLLLPLTNPALFPPSPAQTIVYQEWVNPVTLRALAQAAAGGIGGAAGGATGNVVGAVAGGLLAALLLQAGPQTVVQETTLGLPQTLYTAATAQVQQWPQGTDFVALMHSTLVTLKNAAQLFTLQGSKQTEASMAIETLTFTRSAETGTGEDISIGLKQIVVVSTQTVAVPIPSLPAAPVVPQGQQTPAPAPATTVSGAIAAVKAAQSLLLSLTNSGAPT